MKTTLTLLIAICWMLAPAQAGQRNAEIKDSLLRVYQAAPDDSTRLEALYRLSLTDRQSPTFLYYQNKLLEEAIAQNNIRYQSTSLFACLTYYYNRLDQKRTEQYLYRLEQLAEKNNYYRHYFRGKKAMVEFYFINQDIELGLRKAQDMYDKAQQLNHREGMREACICLMSGYLATSCEHDCRLYLEKAFELSSPDMPVSSQIEFLSKAVIAYAQLHDNENMRHCVERLDSIKSILQQKNSLPTDLYSDLYLIIELHHAIYHIRQQHPAKGLEHLRNAEQYLMPSSFLTYKLTYHTAYAEYFQQTRQYDMALHHLDKAIELAVPVSPDDAMAYGLTKANILVEMGLPDEAYSIYKRISKSRDSLQTVFANSQIEQVQSLYNMDQLLLQREQRKNIFRHICLVIFIVTTLALLFFNIHMYRNKKRLQQNEEEMRKLAIIAEEANEVKNRFLSNMSYNIRIPLNNVVGFSQLLSTDNELDEEERKEYSGIIQANSGELIQLVNDVLDLSRLEADMMKFQLQDCNVQDWCNELGCLIQMRSEGRINLELRVEAGDAHIRTDISRLTQRVASMLLYPNDCKETRKVSMSLANHPDKHIIACRIENSPIADPGFASQKVSVQQKINQLFFEHFKGTCQTGNVEEGKVAVITFTYPTLA